MRNVPWYAALTASLLTGALLVMGSEESMRRLRVVETPEDLASLYEDAQSCVTYDAMSGRFYYPSLGLYLDPVSSMFYDPVTGAYRDSALQGEYSYCIMDDMYYDAVSGRYYDVAKQMSYDPTTGLYLLDGTYFAWDSQFGMLYNPMSGDYYDRGLATHMSYDASRDMFFDYDAQLYYDPSLGLHFDESVGMFYDPVCGRYYDRDTQCYYDPKTGVESLDADGSFYYDSMANAYYNEKDGYWYVYDSMTCLYQEQNSYYDMGMMGMWNGTRYYDPDTGFHLYSYDGYTYWVDETGDMFDPWSRCFFDNYNYQYYYYDSATGGFIDAMSYMCYTPYWMEMGYYSFGAGSGVGLKKVDLSNMYYDSMMGMYYDSSTMLYYDADDGMYFDGMNYYVEPYGMPYYYDWMYNCYVNGMTGEQYNPAAQNSGSSKKVDLSNMYYDPMMGMYYDYSTMMYYNADDDMYYDGMSYYRELYGESYWYDSMSGCYVGNWSGTRYTPSRSSNDSASYSGSQAKVANLSSMEYNSMYDLYYDPVTMLYYDAKISMYTDWMNYYLVPYGDCYYYDSMQNAYVCYMTGDVYYPRKNPAAMTEAELEEIKAGFLALDIFANGPTMVDTMTESRTDMGSYTAAPYGLADALWFKELLEQGMAYEEKRVRLTRGAMPGTLEVSWTEPWAMEGYEFYQSTGLVVPVSESLWNRAVRAVTFTLSAGWNSYSMDSVSLSNDSWGMSLGYYDPMGYYDSMGIYHSGMDSMMGGMGMGYLCSLSAADQAIYNRYANDCDMQNFFAQAVYGGMWSICSMYGNVGLMAGSTTTIGGLQDTDGDGLSDLDEIRYGTNPFMCDTDGDGLNDALEIRIGSCPWMYDMDSDCDGMADVWEEYFGFNPNNAVDANADPDHDGLNNLYECQLGTNPLSADSDGDGLRDNDELTHGTQPLNPDTDNDQLPDGAEVAKGTNPLNPDTDLDGLPDGREVGLGLNPLSVDTDEDGIADCDEVQYNLLGMSAAEKEGSELVRRLRNWEPDVLALFDEMIESGFPCENLFDDCDMDGTPDWVEYWGGYEPSGERDVFSGTDGYPAIFVMTLKVEANNLQRPVMLDLNGEKVCVKRSCELKRYCKEGIRYQLRVVGRQSSAVRIDVAFDDPRYCKNMVVLEDPQTLNGRPVMTGDAFGEQHVSGGMDWYQPAIEITPQYFCFHGMGMNPQKRKTLSARVMPEVPGLCAQFSWWTSEYEEKDAIFGSQVNAHRGHVGLQVVCKVDFSMHEQLESLSRAVTNDVTQCLHKDVDATEPAWCDYHDREQSICQALEIVDCSTATDKVKFLPKKESTGGNATSTEVNHTPESSQFTVDSGYGEPFYVGTFAHKSIPVNTDDDNVNGTMDCSDTHGVFGEDDLRLVSPLFSGHEKCCQCRSHKDSDGIFYVRNVDSTRIQLWCDENKKESVGNWEYDLHQKVYVEGISASEKPDDAGFTCELQCFGSDSINEIVEHKFTAYSLRLLPDLKKDGEFDEQDGKLFPKMKELGLGWCVIPRQTAFLWLDKQIRLDGNITLSVEKQEGEGEIILDCGNGRVIKTNGEKYGVYKGHVNTFKTRSTLNVTVTKPGTTGLIKAHFASGETCPGYECVAAIKVSALDFRIAGDGGVRDGEIRFDDSVDTNLVFWVNNDFDVVHWHEKMFQEDDDSTLLTDKFGVCENCEDDCIGAVEGKTGENSLSVKPGGIGGLFDEASVGYCFRDLEDFDRIHLRYDTQVSKFAGSLKYKIRLLADDDDKVHGIPQINIFRAVRPDRYYLTGRVGNKSSNGEALEVVSGEYRSEMIPQLNERKIMTVDDRWREMDFKDLNVQNGEGKIRNTGWWLYEGKRSGRGTLSFRIEYKDLILAETSLQLKLHSVSDFIEMFQIPENSYSNGTKFDEWGLKVGATIKTAASATLPWTDETEKTYLVLGWNVDPKEKEAWRDTVFKRLFWHGYKGRVGTLVWPTQYGYDVAFDRIINDQGNVDFDAIVATWKGLHDGPHYDRGDHRAWLSAVSAVGKFADEIDKASHVTFLVHSQGNVLMGEMLRRLTREQRGKTTYIALHGAESAQMYTRAFQGIDMEATGIAGLLAKAGDRCNKGKWKVGDEFEPPDIMGHYPFGRQSDNPYLNGVLGDLRHSANFYNRNDYALNIWLGNNATKPDNLARIGKDDRSFGFTNGSVYGMEDETQLRLLGSNSWDDGWVSKGYFGRFYQNRGGKQVAIYPGDGSGNGDVCTEWFDGNGGEKQFGAERAKWCVFSFVAKSPSLAIGQLNMDGYFDENIDLKQFAHTDHHYYHSHEFRANSAETWRVWTRILENIRKKTPYEQIENEKVVKK